jgi:FAD-dependent oxidoreductase family protein
MIDRIYDVVVIGAGTAGFPAAIQAAKAGAKTLLIEKSGMPGGTITMGGVDFPGLFHAWGKQVIAGIGWSLVERCVREGGGEMPDFSRCDLRHWQLQVKINSAFFACLLDEAFVDAGVEVLYHAMPFEVAETEVGVELSIASKEGVQNIECKALIDASGDANAVEMAGYGLVRSSEKQPSTPMVRFGGYDIDTLDLDSIEFAYHRAVEKGEMKHTDTGMSNSMGNLLNNHGQNCIHVAIDDASSSQDKTKVEQEARKTVLRVYRFLKQFDGLENLAIEYLAPECGIRETAVIRGEETITVEDYSSGRRWPDSLCYAFYPIDLHLNTADGLLCTQLDKGVVPTVPLRALIPGGSKYLLAAGRCVSSDQMANSALRVQAASMAMGQAAGAAAALAAQSNIPTVELNIDKIKQLLVDHGAIVP